MYAIGFISSLSEWEILLAFCSIGAGDSKYPIMIGQEWFCLKCPCDLILNLGEGIWGHMSSVLKKHEDRGMGT